MRRSRLIPTLAVAALAVGLATGTTTASATSASPTSASASASSAAHAEAVLHQAEALFGGTARPGSAPVPFASTFSATPGLTPGPTPAPAPAAAPAPSPSDPTLTLVQLAHVVPQLSAGQQVTARSILARPTAPNSGQYGQWTRTERQHRRLVCGPHVCVHWTDDPTGKNHPSATDVIDATLAPGSDGIPDQVDRTLNVVENVWTTEVDTLGYRAPKPDDEGAKSAANRPKVDIYLSDVGANGLYGFCAPEQSSRRSYGYCVLDNDYRPGQFGSAQTRLADLEVTAAHEFFHDVQFNYDSFEDIWFMEATAVWMEDEVYPAVNDNLQYLTDGPMSRPRQPLDLVDSSYLSAYGSWVFLRYLTDTFDPSLVLTAWTDAIGPTYSLQALSEALQTDHTTVSTQFADFSAANTAPAALYPDPDGALYKPYVAEPNLTARLGGATRSTGWLTSPPLKHLTSQRVRIVPVVTSGHLKIQIDGPPSPQQPRVRLVIRHVGGLVEVQRVPLVHGSAVVTHLAFGSSTVHLVDIVLVNGSTRTRCHEGTSLACGGQPTDNASVFRVRATQTA